MNRENGDHENRKRLYLAKMRALEQCFYMDVHSYILAEYQPRISYLFDRSEISDNIVELISQYFWGGNTVQYTAGQVADLIKSKYAYKLTDKYWNVPND